MAAIALSDCTVSRGNVIGNEELITVTTPSSADSADTVDCSTLIDSRTVKNVEGFDQTTGDDVTATISSGVVTIDAAGGTTNKVYVVSLRVQR